MPGKAYKLKDEHRELIVRELACYSTPSEIVEKVHETFGVEITAQGIRRYDPTCKAGKHMSKRWRELFDLARKEFRDNFVDAIPLANKAVRIKKLAKAAEAFERRQNYVAMANMIEGIAKEVGNVHTNRRELTGKDGKPIQTQDVSGMTDDQINAELAALLGGFVPIPGTAGPATLTVPAKKTEH